MKTIRLFLLTIIFLTSFAGNAQEKFFTKSGKIFFKCTKSPLEKIEAVNKSGICVLDTKTGNLQFAVMIKGFEFEKALMQEHFNENYVESNKYPKAEFKGQIVNNDEIKYNTDGSYTAKINGALTIHGEIKNVETTGTIQIKNGKLSATTDFIIQLSDFKISIPSLVNDKISNTVNISVDCGLELLKS